MKPRTKIIVLIIVAVMVIWLSIASNQEAYVPPARESKIPDDIEKMTPELDPLPPILHSDEFETPVPLAVINTAGGEDSAFIPESGDELYFFFTPDVRVPVERQVTDEVTGIYVSRDIDGAWQEPTRVMLQKPGKPSLDGCQFVQGDYMLFCSVREGYAGIHWFSAERKNNRWVNWRLEDFDPEYDVGELHIHGDELYYHSHYPGNQADYNIWKMKRVDGEWQNSVLVTAVSSNVNDGWPYITPDGSELWFTRWHSGSPAIFRSKRVQDQWQESELIVSQFAGEPTLDRDGNLYFTHHYYENGEMLDADIYVAYKK